MKPLNCLYRHDFSFVATLNSGFFLMLGQDPLLIYASIGPYYLRVNVWKICWSFSLKKKKKRKEYGCTYGWFLLIYDRKAQKSVKQSSFNKKIIKPERKIPIQYTNAYI